MVGKIPKVKKPYFYINGYNFHVGTNANSDSEINLIKNKMFVPGKNWGYTDIQWTNFTGETLTIEVYSRNSETYTGDPVQPSNGGIANFYNEDRTPHGVLKYWAQNFVPCVVKTNLHAFENATYVIEDIKQKNPHSDFVVTNLTLIQFERPGEIRQTYYTTVNPENKNTSSLSAQAYEVSRLKSRVQKCMCNKNTPASQCTASYNYEVEIIQKYLQQWGYFPSYMHGAGQIEVNGKYCYYTTEALKSFQEDRGIEVTGNFNASTRNQFVRKISGI